MSTQHPFDAQSASVNATIFVSGFWSGNSQAHPCLSTRYRVMFLCNARCFLPKMRQSSQATTRGELNVWSIQRVVKKCASCATVRTSVLVTELTLGITQLASHAVRPPWAVLAPKRWRWPAGFLIELHQLHHTTSASHISIPQKDPRLVLNDSIQEFHIAALVRTTDSKLVALEVLRVLPCQSLQGNKRNTCSKIILPHSQQVSVDKMSKHH